MTRGKNDPCKRMFTRGGATHTELAKKVCPGLHDSACWRSGEITQLRTNFFGQLCTYCVYPGNCYKDENLCRMEPQPRRVNSFRYNYTGHNGPARRFCASFPVWDDVWQFKNSLPLLLGPLGLCTFHLFNAVLGNPAKNMLGVAGEWVEFCWDPLWEMGETCRYSNWSSLPCTNMTPPPGLAPPCALV